MKRICALLLSITLVLTFAVPAFADDETSDGFNILIAQNKISDGGCTWCSLMMILQNSHTINNPDYQLPDNTWIGDLTSTNGTILKNALLNAKGSICNDPSYNSSTKKIEGGGCAYNLGGISYADGWSSGVYEGYTKTLTGINGKNFNEMTTDELLSCFKLLYNAGYWVQVFIDYKANTGENGKGSTGMGNADHAIALSNVTDTDVFFADPAGGKIFQLSNLPNDYKSMKIEAVHVYQNSSVTMRDSYSGGQALQMTYADIDTVGEQLVNQSYKGVGFTESDLSSYMIMGEDISVYEDLVTTDIDSLAVNERTSLNNWMTNVNEQKLSFNTVLRRVLAGFGIALVLWAMFLYVGFWVDRLNNIIEFSFVHLLTFGKLKTAMLDTDSNFGKGQKETYVSHADIIRICLIAIGFGVLILTGTIYRVIFWLIQTVQNAIHRV